MQKNVAGQKIGAQLVSATDGSAFSGTVTVYVTGDAGTQAIGSVGSGVCTHEGNGYHTYAPSQAETNYNLIAFTFTGSGAVPVTVQVITAINPVTAVPTAAQNATQVRTELATELGRIDVAVSTRASQTSVDTIDDFLDTEIAAIKAKTDNLPSDPADASVIAASFEEIKGAGWSSSTDTLEKIAESSGGSTVSISIPAATAQTVLDSTTAALALYRGTTFSYQFTGLGTMTTWSKVYFTVRPVKKTADAQSLIQIVVTNPSDGADGLKYLNGAATTASWGSIVVDNTSTGSITVTIKPNATTLLAEQYGVDYDVKVILSDSTIPILAFGTLSVIPDVTRAIT